MGQAYAVSGAVIVSQDGTRCYYQKKCENCGHIEPGQSGVSIPSRGSQLTSMGFCSRCKGQYRIVIQGG
jgi:hypothetical protein